jgi:CubicO group peptidase (beta-lactamase class C family)
MKNIFLNPPQDYKGEVASSGSSEANPLFCNARNLAVFSQMLLNRGLYDHQRYFKSSTVDRFTGSWGPWSRTKDYTWMNGLLSSSAFGHFSSAGSFLWIDPAKDLLLIFLTNGSEKDEAIAQVQRQIIESVISEIQTGIGPP